MCLHSTTRVKRNSVCSISNFMLIIFVPLSLASVIVILGCSCLDIETLHCQLFTAGNLEQVANLLCAQANSASYPQ